MYHALYRKWRPRVFEDVVGQDYIVSTLKNEIMLGRVSHAYLFTGSRGTGKTSCAKIFSKTINCPNAQNGVACLECSVCLGIDSGNMLDISEIDAASNNGVENIRTIREETLFLPSVCKYRIYIVDEVHMLSTGAFNALLKILEEPPSHIIFILATTDVHKVPLTIISRCQRFNFFRISPQDIYKRLDYICEQENINIESEALNLISNVSDGALRDALSMLDQFANHTADKITLQDVKDTFGFINSEYILQILQNINNNELSKCLILIQNLYIQCINFSKLSESMLEYFRNLLWYKTLKDSEKKHIEYPIPIKFENAGIEQIFNCVEEIKKAFQNMTGGNDIKCEFEICILKIFNILNYIDIPKSTQEQIIEIPPQKTVKSESSVNSLADFPLWSKILELLEKKLKSKSMVKAFKNSRAFETGNLLLIQSENSLVFEFLRDTSHREEIRATIKEITGKHYNLGPYKSEIHPNTPEKKDPIDSFYQDALSNNISASITK